MDAPLHFEEEGTAIHQIPCDVYVGKCTVLDLASTGSLVMDRELASNFQGVERLLIRTRHSYADVAGPYEPHEALMTAEAASLLLDYGMVLIGTDRLSVDGSGGSDFSLHRRILKAECAILEGLLLAGVEPGQYFLCAAPLPLLRREASPVRALLLDVDFAAKEVVPSE
jgi:arylformamidase